MKRARWVPGLLAAAMVTGGCAPFGMPAPPGENEAPGFGPTLVLELVNASDSEASATYQFEGATAAGTGEASVPACQHWVLAYGQVDGAYEVAVDGTTVIEAEVLPDMLPTGYLYLRLRIDADGTPAADGPPRWIPAEPEMVMDRSVPGCG